MEDSEIREHFIEELVEMKTYTTAEFAKKAHVSVRTIRYYDDIDLLKPSCYDVQGNRCYTEEDFFRLQKVLSLKYFGFSLKEIEELTREKSFEEILSNGYGGADFGTVPEF